MGRAPKRRIGENNPPTHQEGRLNVEGKGKTSLHELSKDNTLNRKVKERQGEQVKGRCHTQELSPALKSVSILKQREYMDEGLNFGVREKKKVQKRSKKVGV